MPRLCLVQPQTGRVLPETSGLQSLAQGGPFPEKISIYAGFLRISEAPDGADTDQIRISTYPVTYPVAVRSMKLVTASVGRELDAYRDRSNRLLDRARAPRLIRSFGRRDAARPYEKLAAVTRNQL